MRLIDADALMQNADYKGKHDILTAFDVVSAPTIDAVHVVRCGECKHYNAGFECLIEGYGIERPKDWFCADGERREDNVNRCVCCGAIVPEGTQVCPTCIRKAET